jgi:glucuronate isomerase
MAKLSLHPDRLFPSDERTRAIARALYAPIKDLPIVSPHGHTDPAWFAYNEAFANPAELLIVPDHYVFRMLYSQGVPLEALGVPTQDGSPTEADPRMIWKLLAENYYLLRGTPSRAWLDWVFAEVFKLDVLLEPATADLYYDTIDAALKTPDFRPRALFERYNIEVIATTESPLDPLAHHKAIRESGWTGKVVTAYRPDPVLDPEHGGFAENVQRFGELAGEDVSTWAGYLRAHENRRAFFREAGATSTDHGHPTAFTADLSRADAEALYARVLVGSVRSRAVPRPDADRDGAHVDRGRHGDAAPSRCLPQPQCRRARSLWSRQGRGYPGADRICPRAQALARPVRQ